MTDTDRQRIVLASRPKGRPAPADFRLEAFAPGEPGEGEVLLRIRYLSLDPYMRGRMSEAKSYAAPTAIGDVMPGATIGEVIQSRDPRWRSGDLVLSYSGWQTHAVAKGSTLRKLDPAALPPTTALGVHGMPGFTAYAGLLTIGRPKPGETVVVAAASGPVGSAVGQIARLKGARAVGIAGGPRKCELVRETFGFDAVVDHKSPSFAEDLKRACPDGIDVYFENVGGAVWNAVFPLLAPFARVPVCGLVAHYNREGPFEGPDQLPVLMRDVLTKSLQIRGFIQTEFADQETAFARDMARWLEAGQVRYKEDIVEGLAKTPEAFIGLLEGQNMGKLIVKLA